jgi:hypothetical protein
MTNLFIYERYSKYLKTICTFVINNSIHLEDSRKCVVASIVTINLHFWIAEDNNQLPQL